MIEIEVQFSFPLLFCQSGLISVSQNIQNLSHTVLMNDTISFVSFYQQLPGWFRFNQTQGKEHLDLFKEILNCKSLS